MCFVESKSIKKEKTQKIMLTHFDRALYRIEHISEVICEMIRIR